MNHLNSLRHVLAASVCLTAIGGSALADKLPPEKDLSGLEYELIGRTDLYDYRALDSYSEAPFLADMAAEGKLPAVKDRLPKEPLVFKTGAMVDGTGEYGGVFRHVIGGRPEGWNWLAGQHQGWGGINMAIQECLVRQGPRWQIKSEDQTGPLPNLAKSWSWNDDNTQLTMHLIEGAHWSDGDPFDTEDIRFWWEDNVEDENVSSRLSKGSLAPGAKLEILDDYTFRWTFSEPQSETLVENLAYIQGCPGPSHALKDKHPKYNPDATYESYTNAMPGEALPVPVMGAWVPVLHKPDELVVMRRNPFYWKVDEKGQQLPYFNEMHFRLSTWDDRTTQAVAGSGDFSNMENPANYVAALKQSQSPDSPVTVRFGKRALAWRLELNFSDIGAEDEVDLALRDLFRNKDFRIALSHALDRDAIGQAVARGPFAYPYTGGFTSGSAFFDYDSTAYQPFDQAKANAMLDELGLQDTDGNGIRNLPNGGDDIEIDVIFNSGRNETRKQLDAVISQLGEVGIRIIARGLDKTNFETARLGGAFNGMINRRGFPTLTREPCNNMPISASCPFFHQSQDGERTLLPFEEEIQAAYRTFISSNDSAEKLQMTRDIQRLITENAYVIGTIQTPAALLVNRRIKNAHPGTPVYMFEWAEDGIIRERLWTPTAEQVKELLPGTIAEY
ncbi:ABC transporter substrate-binding protein [Roseibium sp. SCP14]|uniref:ABC transporter substrate-binding protein n=1 Tax=Roseibium sp. SCP14 TaxID=3141375 RepID=UPI0033383373